MTVRDSTLITSDLEEQPTGPQRPGLRRAFRPLATLRNIWRQLTSMRTALILLFLLAVASLPGALLPQWQLNAGKTAQYIIDHGWWGQLLDKLSFFRVFSSPWYAAIYLLLFTSLVGCVLPRSWVFVRQLRQKPVVTPRNLSRLPHHGSVQVSGDIDVVADRIEAGLRGWRVARREEVTGGAVTISAEKGFIREAGNLVFHLSLLGLLVAIAAGRIFGFEGSIIVNAGTDDSSGFCSISPVNYDNFRPGLAVDGTDLNPFCVQVDSFEAQYTETGQASSFAAQIRYQTGNDLQTDTWKPATLEVNDPLRLSGQRLYLLGHGYSPTFTVTYPDGQTQTRTQPFQPQDSNFTSQGAVKFTDPPGVTGDAIRQHQLAIVGIFAPSSLIQGGVMVSTYPAAEQPGVAIQVYRGDLGIEDGVSQSVFSIDQSQVDKGALKQVAMKNLAPGESVALDDGASVKFDGYVQWVSLQTSYDPAQGWALIFAITLLVGLMTSLTIKRRRVWYRIRPISASTTSRPPTSRPAMSRPETGPTADGGDPGRTVAISDSGGLVVEIGGLARTDQAGYGEEFGKLVALVSTAEKPPAASAAGKGN